MDFESSFNTENTNVEYGIIDADGNINYSTDRYAVVVPANSTNKEYYIKVSIDDKAYPASFTARMDWILQGCDPQSKEYLTYENLDIQGSDGVYTASYTGGYIHTGELVYPAEINGSPVTAVASSSTIEDEQKSYIKSVTIPDSVTTIENNAFNGFSHLEEVVFGSDSEVGVQSVSTSSLQTIGEYAFANCVRLDYLTLPSSVTTIGKNVFENCYNLKQMTLPEGVTTLTDAMFKNCSSIISVELSKNIVNIPAELFNGCTELVNFNMPKYVETIGASAFKNCSRLVGKIDLHFVKNIAESAFENCFGLTEIIVGENVTILNNSTFENCGNLQKIYLLTHNEMATLSDINVLNNIGNNCKIYVIETLMDAYMADRNWTTYSNKLAEIGYTTTGECVDSLAAPVIDMRIYGNSIQNGTPTPDSPVEIESVGEKTKNLFKDDENTRKNSCWLKKSGEFVLNASEWATTDYIRVEGYSFTLSRLPYATNPSICAYDSEKNFITGVAYDTKESVIISSEQLISYIRVSYKITDPNFPFMQLEQGDVATEYEPYGKYKIPVKINGEITNIYLDEPLRKVGDVADYIDFKTGKVVRNIYNKTVTGNESIEYSTRSISFIAIKPKAALNSSVVQCLSNYYAAKDWETLWRNGYGTNASNIQGIAISGEFIRVVDMLNYPNANTDANHAVLFKAWAAEQYQNGTPLIINYVLEDPIEELIDLPDIRTMEGGTTFEVLTTVPPSQIMVKYHK